DPALVPAFVDDGMLNRLDTDSIVIDIQCTGRFARGRADPAGKLRKVIGGVQYSQRLTPFLPIHQIVPVRNDVVDRASVVAERYAAVHAASTLLFCFRVSQWRNELAPMFQPRQ